MYKATREFLWFKDGELIKEVKQHWLDEKLVKLVEEPKAEEEKEDLDLDLNGDGVVDGKDASIGAKVMNEIRKKKRASRAKKKSK